MFARTFAFRSRSAALVLIDRTAGTNIGNMTIDGGLAAAFDGNTDQVSTNCANLNTVTSAYVGKTLAASKVFGRAIIYGSNNQGFWGSNPADCVIDIYGKTGAAPASATDGTIIGTSGTFADLTGAISKQIESNNLVNTWAHIWAHTRHSSAATNARVAELILYEWA